MRFAAPARTDARLVALGKENEMTELPLLQNPIRQRLAASEPALGMVVRLARSGDIARIAKTSGMDFLFLDVQHAIYSLETIGHIAQTALGCGIAPLVRVRSCRDPDTAVMLDCGATGIVFPDVNTAQEARLAVDTCKYAPIGRRSLTTGYAIFDYKPVPPTEIVRILNESTLVVCMIETAEGLRNVDEIAAVEGVDVILIGLTDLLYSLGKPGALDDPAVMDAVDRAAAAARNHGKVLGLGGDTDPQRQAEYLKRGVRFFTLPSDGAFVLSAASASARSLRALAAA
jgi:2-keto-3-deoxy-L-rhamnonate aldolase RhmA